MKRGFTIEEAERIATELGIHWLNVLFDAEQFRKGLDVELEHGKRNAETNVTNDDPVLTGKITWAHLLEHPDYYDLLELVESGALTVERGPEMTTKELSDAVESYDRTVSFAATNQTSNEGRAMAEHPNYIKVAGHFYKLQPEEAPSTIRVNGFEYDRVDAPEEPEAPSFIRVKGMLFHRDDELTREAAKKKGKGKGEKDDKKGKKKPKKNDKKSKKDEKKDDKKGKKGKGKGGKKAPAEKSKGKWEKLPKGWTEKSAKSFWNSIGGSVTECKRKLKDAEEIDNTGAFCASLKDRATGSEGWRKGPKKKKKSKKAAVDGVAQFIAYKGVRYELES